jgi:hypothetical protein
MLAMTPFVTSKKPSAGNLRPSRAFTWVKQIVIAAADVKPDVTDVEIKLTMKPGFKTHYL